MTNRRAVFAAGLAVAVTAAFTAAYAVHARGSGLDLSDRQARVADRGAAVMPFDLDRTTHVFAKRPDGGVQTVVADRPEDGSEIANIRHHLRKEAAAFRRGNFDDPAAIHGMEMPGLAELRAGFARVRIRYVDVPSGGRIRYSTAEPALVRALHVWFDIQLMDHGSDARSG